MKDFLVLFRNLTALIVIIWILFNFVIGVTIAENDDMRPGIRAGDVLICYRIDKKPVLRELIIFKKNGHEYAGRVVAAGGDKVEFDENSGLMVNDNVVSEEGIWGRTYAFEGSVVYPLVLEKNEYFVLFTEGTGDVGCRCGFTYATLSRIYNCRFHNQYCFP